MTEVVILTGEKGSVLKKRFLFVLVFTEYSPYAIINEIVY